MRLDAKLAASGFVTTVVLGSTLQESFAFSGTRTPTRSLQATHGTRRSSVLLTSPLAVPSPHGNFVLSAESSSSKESESDESPHTKTFQRQDLVQIAYQTTSLIYFLVSLLHVARKGINFWSLYYAIGGPTLVAGLCYILRGAAAQDRLGSETYKRLNLGLIAYGVMGLSLPVTDPEHFLTPAFAVPPLMALVSSVMGYVYGVIGWDASRHICAVFTDLQEGFQSTWKTIKNLRKQSLDYILMNIMVSVMTLIKGKQVLALMLHQETPASPLAIASRMSRLARLVVFSSVLFTLKDAADRDRLTGTTFVQLNGLSSVTFASLAGYLGWAGGRQNQVLGLVALVFAGITGYNGYKFRKPK